MNCRHDAPIPENSFHHRLDAPGPKRMLALDGGGIRGIITLKILAQLEAQLRAALGRDETFVLADYFDYVGGTSTGAIIATGIALGMPVAKIHGFYMRGAARMLRRAPLFQQIYNTRTARGLTAALKEELGEDRQFGDPRLRTLLMVVLHNRKSDSPWPLSNNPRAIYNQGGDECNLCLPLWQIVRGSTAAPTIFEPEVIKIGSNEFVFEDGAITPYNNPAFILYLMAALPEYRLGWRTGEENLLLVSVGTGHWKIRDPDPMRKQARFSLLTNVREIPSALIAGALNQQDTLCRLVGRCRFGASIDAEIGDLLDIDLAGARTNGLFTPKAFTYVRYDPDIGEDGLKALGLGDIDSSQVRKVDSPKYTDELERVGRVYAERYVDLAHLGPHDPSPRRVAVIAGRRIDAAGTTEPRFPLDRVNDVRLALLRCFRQDGVRAIVSSAACGTDLLALSAAAELGIRRRVVLPYDPATFRSSSVDDRPGAWRDAFDAVIRDVDARGDLRILGLDPNSDGAYDETNEALIKQTDALAAELAATPMAIVAWDGERLSGHDVTADLLHRARDAGFSAYEIPILGITI